MVRFCFGLRDRSIRRNFGECCNAYCPAKSYHTSHTRVSGFSPLRINIGRIIRIGRAKGTQAVFPKAVFQTVGSNSYLMRDLQRLTIRTAVGWDRVPIVWTAQRDDRVRLFADYRSNRQVNERRIEG